jgi:PKD repeat protein
MNKFLHLFYAVSMGLCLAFAWLLHPSREIVTFNAKGIVFNTKAKVPKKDRMDLAWQQELELTMDPALGYAPKERLLEAWQYQQSLLGSKSLGKAAIPGVTWTERGPNNCGGRTRAVLIDLDDPTRNTVWAGGVAGGLWKTDNISQSVPIWTPINDFFQNLAITSITQAPANPSVMYFATGEGNGNLDAVRGLGVWKSTNGGQTWTQLSATNNSTYHYNQKIMALGNGDTLFVCTRVGLMRSTNGGASFTKVLGAGIASAGGDIAQDIEIMANGTLYASMSGTGATSGTIHRSFTRGATWTNPSTISNTPNRREIEIAVSVVDTSTIYGLVESGSRIVAIIKSVNAGANFDTIPAHPIDADGGVSQVGFRKDFSRAQAWYDLSIAVDPNNVNVVVVGGIDLFKTSNGGSSWQQLSHWYGGFGFQEVHADQHFALFSPGSSSICYFGNDGGVYRSADFTSVNPTIDSKEINYNTTQFYACDIHPNAGANIYVGGTQDNGSHKFSNPGINSTIEVTGGDGAFCHIDQDQPQFWFTSYVYTNYYRSTNGGNSFGTALGTSGNVGSFINPSDYDDIENKMYLSANTNCYSRWDNPQTGNNLIFDTVALFNGGRVTHVKVSPNVSNKIYFGTNGGRIVSVDNAHTTTGLDSLQGAPTSGSVSCIEIENGNENHVLVTYSNYGVNSVWETKNSGVTWTSVEGNLPDMPIRWIIFNPNKNWQAMVATELGVWTTDSLRGATTDWQPSNTGFANVRTDMLKLRGIDKQVVAATHGRGFYTSNVFAPPFADFDANKKLSYVSAPIQFTSTSNGATTYLWDFGDGTTSTLANPMKQYFAPGFYNVSLTINGMFNKVANSFIQILPYRGVPYTLLAGGDFETNANDFAPVTISGVGFVRGVSAVTAKSGVASGSNAWVTGLTGNYADNNEAHLYTPSFNCKDTGTYVIRFKVKNAFEINYDGYIVEYSTNLGATWQKLGSGVQTNWYDYANTINNSAFPINVAFFNATRSAYTQLQYNFSALAGNTKVCFRFVFKSDGGITAAGMALDDFEITGPNNAALPVSLINFNAKRITDNQVDLGWQTASEKNNKGFAVERSEDGFTFHEIGFVAGAGNTSTKQSYRFSDMWAVQDQLYYRLKQVDEDGQSSYSRVQKVSKSDLLEPLFEMSQIPGLNVLNLNIQSDKILNAILFTNGGAKVREQSFTKGLQQLDMQGLAPGIYLLQMTSSDGRKQAEKVLCIY